MANKKKIDMETEIDLTEQYKKYAQHLSTIAEGYLTKIFSKDIINEIDMETLKTYFANPDDYQKELGDLALYHYISNGEIFQLLELPKILPSLNYKLQAFEKPKNIEKQTSLCKKKLYKIKHKKLTRDLISQNIACGTLVGIWLGDSKNPYPYIFDNLKYIYPAYRQDGEWIVQIDLNWLKEMSDDERNIQLSNLSPFLTKAQYEAFEEDENKKFIELPQDRAFVLQTHTVKRNQRFGLNWTTPGLFELGHKKKLKDLEKSVANKIINALAVLKIGDSKNAEYANLKLPPAVKKKVHAGVKAALDKNSTDGITLIAIPDFADIEFPDMKSDALEPDKFTSINNDILSAYGVSTAMVNGQSGNYASAKINLDVFYRRIAILLEDIETEVYGKLFNLILPSSQRDNIQMVYDKEPPLSLKEKVDILMKLHTQEGFSLKAVLDNLDGIDFDDYVEQSIYEQEELKLQEKIQPYASAYTGGADNSGGRPSGDGSGDNNNRTNDTNNIPSA